MLVPQIKFWKLCLIIFFLKWDLVDPIPRVGKVIPFDSVKDALAEEADQLEEVANHSELIVGFGHLGNETEGKARNPNLSPLLQPSDKKIHHKTRPPVIGSLCDYEDYSNLFSPYYDLSFLNFAERLHEHKFIEKELNLGDPDASNERAWSICQFGGNMMECGENRKCQCLDRNPPYRYVFQKGIGESNLGTCVGQVGSICSNDLRAPTNCEKGLNCTHGYCGGLNLAARTLHTFLGRAPSTNSTRIIILIMLGLIFNLVV